MKKALKQGFVAVLLAIFSLPIFAQQNVPCSFDELTNNNSLRAAEKMIQARINTMRQLKNERDGSNDIRIIPVVIHLIHDGGSSNISQVQIESQMVVLNEDYGKLTGTNGDGDGVDTRVRFCLAKLDPDDNCTNGVVRIESDLAVHKTYQRALLKELSFWDNERYMNIYVVKSINGNVGGYSSFPGGPADEDGMVVRQDFFGRSTGTASGTGRVTSHEIGHWFGLYHTFNNGCGEDVCTDGDYVCDTPPQATPNFDCSTLNTCSNDNPDENDLQRNYLNYTPGSCQNMLTQGQADRMHATLDTIRTVIWSETNLVSTGCNEGYSDPFVCPVVADFVTLTPEICDGNSIYFMNISLNNATTWQWTFEGGNPASSTEQNPTVTYNNLGSYDVKLTVADGTTTDSLTVTDYVIVSLPGVGNPLYFAENFDAGLYPPAEIEIANADGGVTWELDSLGFVSPSYSFRINNIINTNYGSADDLVLPYFDFTSLPVDSSIYMSFKWAYARSDASFSDELIVLLSTDCGTTFDQVFYKKGGPLVTGPTQTTSFVPDSSQWKSANIDLDEYEDESYVLILIKNITDGGNNLYIDNIYVGDGNGSTGISEVKNAIRLLSIYPNPTSENATIEYSLQNSSNVNIEVFTVLGQHILTFKQGQKSEGEHHIILPTSELSNGLYLVKLETETGEKTIKLFVAE